jgi:hypothetical protein
MAPEFMLITTPLRAAGQFLRAHTSAFSIISMETSRILRHRHHTLEESSGRKCKSEPYNGRLYSSCGLITLTALFWRRWRMDGALTSSQAETSVLIR